MSIHPLKKIHIVHIIPTLRRGGAERLVVDLANSTNRKKFQVSIITFSSDVPLAKQLQSDVMLHIIEKRGKYDMFFYRRLRGYLQGMQADIVHTHLFGGDVYGALAAAKLHIPMISTEHNINENESYLHTVIKRYTARFIDWHIAISEAVEQDLNSRYEVPSSYISRIPNGIKTSKFLKIPAVKKIKKQVNILVVGRLEEQKGHALLLDMLSLDNTLNYSLTILGNGTLRESLKKQAKSLGIDTRITWKNYSDSMPQMYKEHDIVIIPSLWEGFGIVCIEAMAAGRVVMASNVGGLREIIRNKKTGILFDIHSPKSFYNALSWIQKKSDKIPAITSLARETAEKKYDIASITAAYEASYTDLITL